MSGLVGVLRLERGGAPGSAPETLSRMAAAAAYRATRDTATMRLEHGFVAELRDGITASVGGEVAHDDHGRVVVSDAWLHNTSDLIGELGLAAEASASAVILSAYRRWGTEAPERLVGEFAFVIWDPSDLRVLAARDAMGMRPLCFITLGNELLFASEIAQLLAHPDVPRRLRPRMVGLYLAGATASADETFYEGIRHVPAGHTLVWDGLRRSELARYWPTQSLELVEHHSESEYVEHFLAIFSEAVAARLQSGLNVGISLSGGLDSGSIASVAGLLAQTGKLAGPPSSYSYAFESYPECDERSISDSLVRDLGLHKRDVPGDDGWPTSDFPQHPPDLDDPLIGPFRALNRRLAQMAASDGVEVIVSGMRGDIMMGLGIAEYIDDLLRGRWGRVWQQLQAHSAATGLPIRRLLEVYVWRELRRRAWPASRASSIRSFTRRALGLPSPLPPWLHPDLAAEIGPEPPLHPEEIDLGLPGWARRERAAAVVSSHDVREVGWLDRIYSRYGVRITDPWSDKRIAEFAIGVPQRILNAPGKDKRLLREAMTGLMPEEARLSASKGSLRPLFDAGLRELGRDTVLDLLTGMMSAEMGFVAEPEVRSHYDRYALGGPGDFRLWWVLTLEMWLRAHWSPRQ